MKQLVLTVLFLGAAFGISLAIYEYLLPDYVRQGGPLVVLLITLSLLAVTYVFERLFTLRKARGKKSLPEFLKNLQMLLAKGDLQGAIALCNQQRGSLANVVRSGLERFDQVRGEKLTTDQKIAETRRAIEEANMLEVPLLERNLISLSTIASISTMVGLLGTTIGMIRSFRAMGHAGAPDAIQLAVGISEALINTAGGLFIAIGTIVAYNVFVTRVDNFNYMMDEATYEVMQLLSAGGKHDGSH